VSLEFDIAKRYMSSRRRYAFVSVITLISIVGIIIGTAALVIVLSVMNGFESEIRSRILGTGSDIIVSSVSGEGIDDWEGLSEKIKSVPGVIALSPVVHSKSAIASRNESDGVLVRGIVPELEARVSSIDKYLLTRKMTFAAGDSGLVGIWLGVNLADRLGVGIYDKVKLFSLRDAVGGIGGIIPKALPCQVTGIFETGMYEYDANLVYIPLDAAQSLFNIENRISDIAVKTKNYNDADRIARAIDEVIGFRYYSTDWKVLNKNLFSWMTLEKWASFIILSLIIAVAAFNIISSLIMVVLEKKKDIGILMSLGLNGSRIRKIFMIQGVTVGLFGGALGCLLGFLLCLCQQSFHIITLPAEYYFISALPVKMKALDFLSVGLAAFLLSLLATIYPATRASSLNPVEAIRYE